jgi:sigma-B regulation protein RsbU (phosphoserine phosphatase)
MYATLAMLSFDDSIQAEYALVGHVPILHYRHLQPPHRSALNGTIPLGSDTRWALCEPGVSYLPHDLFLLLTDGITEVVNEREEEFGLARLEQLLSQHADQPLSQIWELVMGEVKQHGVQQDDQSLLLLRVRQ